MVLSLNDREAFIPGVGFSQKINGSHELPFPEVTTEFERINVSVLVQICITTSKLVSNKNLL